MTNAVKGVDGRFRGHDGVRPVGAGRFRGHDGVLLGLTLALALGGAAQAETPGQVLYDHGISLTLNYTGEAAANPSGGIRQGSDYTGQVYLGADFDLSKIASWQGATLHVAITDRHGRNLAADDIGNNTSVQEVYGWWLEGGCVADGEDCRTQLVACVAKRRGWPLSRP